VKEKSETLFGGGILLLEGSQRVNFRPSDKDEMKVKTSGW
jgi:hypothetical protein